MKKTIALILAIIMVVALLPTSVFALSGTAEYEPAESNISGKYWVTFSSDQGDAALAADGDYNTAWTWEAYPVVLAVDLGGTYDAVRKINTVFADADGVYEYILEGSTDGVEWTVLADKAGNDNIGANYTDIFAFEGLRYVKLTVLSGPVGVSELEVINYLREDMNNGSDSSTVSWSNSYYYNARNNPAVEGYRGGKLEPATMETGNNFFGLVKDLGWDTTRLRVWNEPKSEGDWRYAGDINEAIAENWPAVDNSSSSCSPDAQAEYAKYIVGAGQQLAIDFHYSDSWSDPQNQPKPYAWAELEFDELVDTVYDFTYDYIKRLIDQDTAPSIVAIGNEITNGMMWGSEYLEVNEFADYHDYYKRFIRDNSPENMSENGRTIDGTKINPDATEGGGVKWVKYAEANGDTESEAYKEFLDSINNLARLVDAGNRAIAALNEEYDLDIQTEMHFAFNVVEQPRNGDKVVVDEEYVFNKVMTLISNLSADLEGMGGMVDRIGVSYYPDWHGKYETVQRNIVEMSKLLPDVEFNIAECSPSHSGTISSELDNPNYPVGTQYSTQMAGDIGIEIMKVINDVPNNVGQGVWPWNGQSVYGVDVGGCGSRDSTLQASMKSWNDAFAKNVVESSVSVATLPGVAPVLPATVKSLDVATGEITDVAVEWDVIDPAAYAEAGTFTVSGKAVVTVPAEGRGKAMDDVTATISVVDVVSGGAIAAETLTATCGDEVEVDVSYIGDADVSSVRVIIDSALPIADIIPADGYEMENNNGYVVVYSADGSNIDGVLFTIIYDLSVNPWYANGEYPIALEVVDASDGDAENTNVGAINGLIILDNDYPAGDVTLDGLVTNADVIALARYLVNLVEFNAEQLIAADVDFDGVIKNADLIKLARAIVA